MQCAKQSFQRLIAAFQFFPLHGKRRIEEQHDRLWWTRVLRRAPTGRWRLLPATEQGVHGKEAWFIDAAHGGRLGRRWLSAPAITEREHLQRVAPGGVKLEGGDEVFRQVDILSFKMPFHQMWRILLDLQWKGLRGSLKIRE